MQTLEQLRSGELVGVTHLKLRCGLTSFPREILELADTLEMLDLSGNALSALPHDLGRLGKLRIIFCSDNQFTELPTVLGDCPELSLVGFKANRIRKVSAAALPTQLRWLILTDNLLEELPAELGNCSQLQKMMLAGNRLRALPPQLANCQRLELLRIAANRLSELPPWLLSMPRLSWLAYSGNPFCAELETGAYSKSPINDIAWSALALEQVLGEGASGVIHRAQLREAGGAARSVAVKLFKGAVTSDGLPDSEMAASIAAQAHPALIPVLGNVTDHPSGQTGLVMELIDPEFRNLAGPPSFASCTRDTYAPDTCFSLSALLQLVGALASAAQHLHGRGIMHGDLYGHNILCCAQGRALIGDFGAASFYASDGSATAQAIERLEVRAFACLLEELLERCPALPDEMQSLGLLDALKRACLSDVHNDRPLFAAIHLQLMDIHNGFSNKD